MAQPSPFTIDKVSVNGSGCRPQDNPSVSVGSTSFSIAYNNFLAQTGPGIPLPDEQENCLATLTVTLHQGKRVTLKSNVFQGSYDLPAPSTGELDVTYVWLDQGNTSSTQSILSSGSGALVEATKAFFSERYWSGCGDGHTQSLLTIDASLFVHAPKGAAAWMRGAGNGGGLTLVTDMDEEDCE
jgi:hypothetical protein